MKRRINRRIIIMATFFAVMLPFGGMLSCNDPFPQDADEYNASCLSGSENDIYEVGFQFNCKDLSKFISTNPTMEALMGATTFKWAEVDSQGNVSQEHDDIECRIEHVVPNSLLGYGICEIKFDAGELPIGDTFEIKLLAHVDYKALDSNASRDAGDFESEVLDVGLLTECGMLDSDEDRLAVGVQRSGTRLNANSSVLKTFLRLMQNFLRCRGADDDSGRRGGGRVFCRGLRAGREVGERGWAGTSWAGRGRAGERGGGG